MLRPSFFLSSFLFPLPSSYLTPTYSLVCCSFTLPLFPGFVFSFVFNLGTQALHIRGKPLILPWKAPIQTFLFSFILLLSSALLITFHIFFFIDHNLQDIVDFSAFAISSLTWSSAYVYINNNKAHHLLQCDAIFHRILLVVGDVERNFSTWWSRHRPGWKTDWEVCLLTFK